MCLNHFLGKAKWEQPMGLPPQKTIISLPYCWWWNLGVSIYYPINPHEPIKNPQMLVTSSFLPPYLHYDTIQKTYAIISCDIPWYSPIESLFSIVNPLFLFILSLSIYIYIYTCRFQCSMRHPEIFAGQIHTNPDDLLAGVLGDPAAISQKGEARSRMEIYG